MTLTAPGRLNRHRRFRNTTRLEEAGPTAAEGTLSAAPAGPGQVVLMVDFTSPEGRTWWAVGVGGTQTEALSFAQDSCLTDTAWQPTRWNDL